MRDRIVSIGIGCLIAGIIIGKIFPLWLIVIVGLAIVVMIYMLGRERRTV